MNLKEFDIFLTILSKNVLSEKFNIRILTHPKILVINVYTDMNNFIKQNYQLSELYPTYVRLKDNYGQNIITAGHHVQIICFLFQGLNLIYNFKIYLFKLQAMTLISNSITMNTEVIWI